MISLIFILTAANALTLLLYFTKSETDAGQAKLAATETAASVGAETISREMWMYEMEQRYGKEVLREMINQKVMDQLASQYDIKVTDEELDKEITLIKSIYNTHDKELAANEEILRERVRMELLLEKVVTKDVNIPSEEVERYYQENEDQYSIPEMFNLSQIVADTREEAEQIASEIKDGSSFQALAMERSIDGASAVQGGNIGYIPAGSHILAGDTADSIKSLDAGDFSEVIKADEKFYIFLLHDKLEAEQYSLDDVKDQIRRRLAMEQVEKSIKPEDFWDDLDVEWFYEGSL
ncbi:peptidylprolyl isomerase [Rossellomorea vietnamensis]|uniref:peptidylprolyl isomerase n=1 Tax=Rossellomorea vietnamensis TaxID=218284 RepID=A0A5D4M7Q8_9BACI|nr:MULTISPECIES: peptidyl-prolyl cis-trans isomerase [Bacillaceae]TYR97528.1 peptidylprolyl isomerase [Rossellomorea vietnamensis]